MTDDRPSVPMCCRCARRLVQHARRDLVCVCDQPHPYRRATLPGPAPGGADLRREGASA